jgi:hypothetical protein
VPIYWARDLFTSIFFVDRKHARTELSAAFRGARMAPSTAAALTALQVVYLFVNALSTMTTTMKLTDMKYNLEYLT